jgi:hypothetical protein
MRKAQGHNRPNKMKVAVMTRGSWTECLSSRGVALHEVVRRGTKTSQDQNWISGASRPR